MKRPKIDKSVLTFGVPKKVEDPKYLDNYRHMTCNASDNGIDRCDQPCQGGAHVRDGEVAGTANRPSDDLTESLCHRHHMDQEANPGEWWWFTYCYKPSLRRRYRRWKENK